VSQRQTRVTDDSGPRVGLAATPAAPALPALASGVRLLGRFEGSGFQDDRFLVDRGDGQIIHISRLLYLVAANLDGQRGEAQVADRVSAQVRRRLPPEGVRFLVFNRLAPLGVLATPGQESGKARRADPLLALRLRATLLPAAWVRLVARLFTPLFWAPLIAVVLVALAALDLLLFRGDRLGAALFEVAIAPINMLSVLGLLLLATLFHEFGHATACRKGGARPGRIGVGLYLVLPAFYTDVTDSYKVDRRARLRTDLGGVYFNAVAAVVLLVLAEQTGAGVFLLAAFLVQLEAVQQLLPVVRFDGYYILADIVGVPDLFGRVRPTLVSFIPGRPMDPRVAELRPRVRRIVAGWVLVVVPLLTAALAVLIVRLPGMTEQAMQTGRAYGALFTDALGRGDTATAALAAVSIVLLVLPFLGIAAMIFSLVRRARPLLRRVIRRGRSEPDHLPDQVGSASAEDLVSTPAEHHPGEAVPTRKPDPDEPRPVPLAMLPKNPSPSTSLTAASFTDDTMLRHRARAPEHGWRRALYKATAGSVNLGPSRTEQEAIALRARVQAPVRGCRRVAVLSRKGGAGKTTTTLMLGHTFAELRGDRVVALDANPDAGSLAHRVRRETAETVTSMLEDRQLIDRYSDIRAYTSQASTRLEVIASDDDPRITQALGDKDYSQAVELLDRHYTLILLDTGTGILDSAIQGVLREADQIVIVMPPALDGARAASSTLDWLEEHGFGAAAAGAVAVINSVQDEGLVALDRIEEHFANRCAAVVRVPWDPALAAGARTSLDELKPATREAYLTMAAAVADGFAVPGARR